MTVKTDPVYEAIARKLLGINSMPPLEQVKMIKRAARAGAKAVAKDLATKLSGVADMIDALTEEQGSDLCEGHKQIKEGQYVIDRNEGLALGRVLDQCEKLGRKK